MKGRKMDVIDINSALVEEKRPPIYTAMKYWGKKPHNIWREYIKRYTPENGLCLDPFAGSAMSAFEGVKAGKKVIAFDINPLTSFFIEVLSAEYDFSLFKASAEKIIAEVVNDNVYNQFFKTKCRHCGNEQAVIQNTKWNRGEIFEIGIICEKCNSSKYIAAPNSTDINNSVDQKNINLCYWFPDRPFHASPSFSASFIRNIGGNHFYNIWTRRNLYIISKIFSLILAETNSNVKKLLLMSYIKTIHLCSKMSVPRRQAANRDFSTSWGRAAYLCSSRQMEMNPLLLFFGNCFGKQSVDSAMRSSLEYIGKRPKLLYIDKANDNATFFL